MAVAAKPIQSNGRQQQWLKMFANHSENPVSLPGFSPFQRNQRHTECKSPCVSHVAFQTLRDAWLAGSRRAANQMAANLDLRSGVNSIAFVLLAYPIGGRVYLIG